MFHRCLLILAVLSLTVSGGAAWATTYHFADISALDAQTQYIAAIPDGVASGGYTEFQTNITGQTTLFFSPNVYSGGASGTTTNLLSTFTGAARIGSTNMNASGEFVACQTSPQTVGLGGWTYANGTATQLPSDPVTTSHTYSEAINNNGDTAGWAEPSGNQVPFVYTGGTYYTLTGGSGRVTALNTNGQAVGSQDSSGSTPQAAVWSYSISGGITSSFTNLQLPGGVLKTADSNVFCSMAVAINSTGQVVVEASDGGYVYPLEDPTHAYLYNMNTQALTLLGNLQIYDPTIPNGTGTQYGGHGQAINDSGEVVGQIPNGSGFDAAVWQNGTITDLNTLYASILPAGFVLNNATAIDNSGDIAGYGTDSLTHTTQAFVIYGATPEPGTVALLSAGLAGLLAYAWRKRR